MKNTYGTAPRSCALPELYRGGSTGILLIHGFTGHPGDMKYLGRALNEAGFTVSIPRLPGHGTSSDDFLRTGRHDWLRRCTDSYLDLSSICTDVYMGGHSMGGLLAVILASRFKPAKLALFAPAVTNTNRLIALTPLARYFLRRIPYTPDFTPSTEDEDYLLREYWSYRWMGPSAELYRLQGTARRRLPFVTSDTLLIVSEKDLTVPMKAADIVEGNIGSRSLDKVVLKESGHVVVNGLERETVARTAVKWFLKPPGAGL